MPLSISLRDPSVHPSTPIRPYHTLLLLKEDAVILRSLPSDASPQLRRIVDVANPLKSFEELAIETGIPLAQLFRLAAHLGYLGCGRVVDTLTQHHMYTIHPGADLRPHSPLAVEFSKKFGNPATSESAGPSGISSTSSGKITNGTNSSSSSSDGGSSGGGKSPMSLPKLLSQLSVHPAKVGDFLRGLSANAQLKFIKMLIWLLRHDFLVQLHMYIHFVIPQAWLQKHQKQQQHRMQGGMNVRGHSHRTHSRKNSGGSASGKKKSRLSASSSFSTLESASSSSSSSTAEARPGNDRKAPTPHATATNNNHDSNDAVSTRPRSESFDHKTSRSVSGDAAQSSKGSDGNGSDSQRSSGGIRGRGRGTASKGTEERAPFPGNDAETFEAYRKEYRSFRVGYAKGAKGELNQFYGKSIRESLGTIGELGVPTSVTPGRGSSGSGEGRFSMASYESAYLASIADETPVYTMLKRLSPYFHGKHHVEEIMWRETVSRKAIQSVFATYSNVLLVSVLHPKAASEW